MPQGRQWQQWELLAVIMLEWKVNSAQPLCNGAALVFILAYFEEALARRNIGLWFHNISSAKCSLLLKWWEQVLVHAMVVTKSARNQFHLLAGTQINTTGQVQESPRTAPSLLSSRWCGYANCCKFITFGTPPWCSADHWSCIGIISVAWEAQSFEGIQLVWGLCFECVPLRHWWSLNFVAERLFMCVRLCEPVTHLNQFPFQPSASGWNRRLNLPLLRTWSPLTLWIEWQLIALRTRQIARPSERVVPSTRLSTQTSTVKAEYCEACVRSACASQCRQTTQRGTALGTFCSCIEGLDRSKKAYIGTCYPFIGSFSLAYWPKRGPEWRLIRGAVLVILSWTMA